MSYNPPISVLPHPSTLFPTFSQLHPLKFLRIALLLALSPSIFLSNRRSASPFRFEYTQTHTKLSFFQFVAFLSKRRAYRGKKSTRTHTLFFYAQLGNFTPNFSSLSLTRTHICTHKHSAGSGGHRPRPDNPQGVEEKGKKGGGKEIRDSPSFPANLQTSKHD